MGRGGVLVGKEVPGGASTQGKAGRPLLTVGIASYNYARYLRRAWEALLAQEFRDMEVLYCDDGSTDGSAEMIEGFAASGQAFPVRLIRGGNEGILANRNRILQNAAGRYLLLCDADDYMLPGCLDALCAAAQSGADCVIGGFDEVDGDGRLLKRHVPPPNASKWLYTWHHAQLYRLDLVREQGIRFEALPDDVCYLQQIHRAAQSVVFVEQPLYAWVRHSDSTSNAATATAEGEWSPVRIWQSLAPFIAALRDSLPQAAARRDLDYYLYKWFYLNAADLTLPQPAARRDALRTMQAQMEAACPGYRTPAALCRALAAPDTVFARAAVAGCWLVEQCGLLPLVTAVRTAQKKARARR